jgi:hypothetical protein
MYMNISRYIVLGLLAAISFIVSSCSWILEREEPSMDPIAKEVEALKYVTWDDTLQDNNQEEVQFDFVTWVEILQK